MEIIKPVEHGAVDLLPLEHGIGKPREPVGVDTPRMNNCWTNDCHVDNHIYTFHATLRDYELIRKMWDEGVMESLM